LGGAPGTRTPPRASRLSPPPPPATPSEATPGRAYLPFTVLAFAFAAAGCKDKKGSGAPAVAPPAQPGPGDGGTPPGRPKNPSGEPDFKLTPAEFRAEFARDGRGADQKFRGKVIELDGVVASVGQDTFDRKPGVFLKAEGTNTVFCATADPRPWEKVAPGASARLRGTLPSSISYQSPALADARVIDAGGSKVQSLTAAELTKEFLADPAGTRAKYDKRAVALGGEITDARIAAGDDMIVRLKGERGTTVVVSIKKHGLEGARPGRRLKVFGDLNIPPAGAKELFLYASAPAELK
jgi:hypothetical protein